MGILLKLSSLAGHSLAGAACRFLGGDAAGAATEVVSKFLVERFTDHSLKLNKALQQANKRAWQALEFALAGESLLAKLAREENRAFREQVECALASFSFEHPADAKSDFRQRCLKDLREARATGLLDGGGLELQALANEVGEFTRFASPTDALVAEWRVVEQIADTLAGKYQHLARLLKFRSRNGFSFLTAAVRYFFRREVVTDEDLHKEYIFGEVTKGRAEQNANFEKLEDILSTHGDQFATALEAIAGDIRVLLEKIDVIDVRLGEQAERIDRIAEGIARLLDAHQLNRRPLTSRDSFSYRDEAEREQIRHLGEQYRALPAAQRQERTDLLRGMGLLQVVSGNYDAAERDFRELADIATDPVTKAEAFYNAYQTALEKRDWEKALLQLREACNLDSGRFAPFPMQRYTPQRILGAGGFGVAFLCYDENLKRPAVVKTLQPDNLGGNSESVLAEARVLLEFKHPTVVTLYDCDHADQAARARPYLVMEYFESVSLEDHVRKNGPLSLADFLVMARQVAVALQTAHEKEILHRDVKPANILIRRDNSGLQVKLIDFGLALKQEVAAGMSGAAGNTVLGAALAGTAEYAAPEQMGRLRGVRPGRPADVYSYAKTCCFALFATTLPMRKHWAEIPPNWAHLVDLLERSLSENPNERPDNFGVVLRELVEHHSGASSDGECDRILEQFQKRLSASISRSPILKVSITKQGRLLDVSDLAAIDPDVPAQVLTTIIGGEDKVYLDLRAGRSTPPPTNKGPAAEFPDRLYDLLDRKMRRHAETAKRETGVHALWLGYPLLYASKGSGDAARWILAPVFLWPITIDPEAKLEKHIRIGRPQDPDTARFNRVMALWVRREMSTSLSGPTDDELGDWRLPAWREYIRRMSSSFAEGNLFDFQTPLQGIPQRKTLQEGPGMRLLHSAVLGYFRWQNEAIQADLEAIREKKDFRGVVTGFVSTARLVQPPEVEPPAEDERFLVSDTDFSQERVVWQARTGPGLVVHGPPGTGKSQTIVNVIADTLARGRTVLMVCQKQAATRVVLERLRAVGLADLCLEVHDAEQDRKAVFRAIKDQVQSLGDIPPGQSQRERQNLAQEIAALEAELDQHARSFHLKHRQYELSYRDMKTLEQEQYIAFPSVRPLPSLQRILEGLSWSRVESIARSARDVGRLFAEANPFHNPWRFGRLATIQPSGALRASVRDALDQLRKYDAELADHIRRYGLGIALPSDLSSFHEVGSAILDQLRHLTAAPQALILRWLSVVRKLGAEQRQTLISKVKQGVELAEQVRSTPADPRWESIAASEPDFFVTAEHLLARLEGVENEKSTGKIFLTKHWVKSLCTTPTNFNKYREKCREAVKLSDQLAALPSDPYWETISRRCPDFQDVAVPVVERIERLTGDQNPTLGMIVQAWLKTVRGAPPSRLQQLDNECREAVRLAHLASGEEEPARNVPAQDAADFIAAASEMLERLSRLRGSPLPPKALLARCCLRALQRADDAELRNRVAECREAVDLACQMVATPLDLGWEKICHDWTALQLEPLRVATEAYLQQCGRFLAFLNGKYRRARRYLQRLRPDVFPDSLPSVAASFVDYLPTRERRDRLAALNRRLVPDYPPPANELYTFPRLAEEALEAAIRLLLLGRRHPAYAAVLEEFIWHDGQAGPAEADLRKQIGRESVWPQLEKVNQSLVPELRPRLDAKGNLKYPEVALKGLEQAVWFVKQEQANSWLAPLLDAFSREKGPRQTTGTPRAMPAESIAFPGEKGARQTTPLQNLRSCLLRTRLREQLTAACCALLPAQGLPLDEAALLRYPAEADAALEAAGGLVRIGWQRGWVAPLLEEATNGQIPATGLSLAGLNKYLLSCKLRESLARENRDLIPDVTPPNDAAAQLTFPSVAFQSLQKATKLQDLSETHSWVGPFLDLFLSGEDQAFRGRVLADLECALVRCPIVKGIMNVLLSLKPHLKVEGLQEPYRAAVEGQTLTPWTERIEKGLDGLQALISLESDRRDRSGPAGEALNALEEYEKACLSGSRGPAPDSPLDSEHHGDWWDALVKCSALAAWQLRCHAETSILTRMTSHTHARKVELLKELLSRKRSLETQIIRERWQKRQLPVRNEPWNRMFQERNAKGGSSKSLREAVDLSWDKGLTALRPCWLVGPGAASQIFPLAQGLFDLVIFDEASQCPVEQAIPAIYRGKNLLVAGDEKQLPPTTFFSAGSTVDEDENDEADLEADDNPAETKRRRERRDEEETLLGCSNLLDMAIGKLKQLYLCVHYRSDHPALIEFSNRAFYHGQLEAPPARSISIAGDQPIAYHAVNGKYADRTNPEEATYIVEMLKKLWVRSPASPTLGVVTFNQAQRDLIENLIEQECGNDGCFNIRYQEERERRERQQDVGFFVKNLENVQGDERDVMIFSTTFGKDGQGRFFRRFGPVGATGGHRRLNVAITRAKKQVVIVGSMPTELIATPTLAGAERTPASYLQLYLAYAQAVSAGNDGESRRILNSLNAASDAQRRNIVRETPLEVDVRTVLNGMGCQVERGVGDTGFSIDLGVLHPDAKQGYVLGIECDGGAQYSGRSARIREVWRPGLLGQRGWRLHRVWSDSWWMNRDAEIRRLQTALASVLKSG